MAGGRTVVDMGAGLRRALDAVGEFRAFAPPHRDTLENQRERLTGAALTWAREVVRTIGDPPRHRAAMQNLERALAELDGEKPP